MDDTTIYDIGVILRRLEVAREALRQIPFTIESAEAWNAKTTAACEIAYSVGYMQEMLRLAALESANG